MKTDGTIAALLLGRNSSNRSQLIFAILVTWGIGILVTVSQLLLNFSNTIEYLLHIQESPSVLLFILMFPVILFVGLLPTAARRLRTVWLRCPGSRSELLAQMEKYFIDQLGWLIAVIAITILAIYAFTALNMNIGLHVLILSTFTLYSGMYMGLAATICRDSVWWRAANALIYLSAIVLAIFDIFYWQSSWGFALNMLVIAGIGLYWRQRMRNDIDAVDFSLIKLGQQQF